MEKVAEQVHRLYKKWDKDKGTQLVFLDRSGKKDANSYSRKDPEQSLTPVTFGLIGEVIDGLPIAKSRGAVFPGETAGGAGIVALDWIDMLPAEVKEDLFQKGIPWDEVHGVLHKGVVYIIRRIQFPQRKGGLHIQRLLGFPQRQTCNSGILGGNRVGLTDGPISVSPP